MSWGRCSSSLVLLVGNIDDCSLQFWNWHYCTLGVGTWWKEYDFKFENMITVKPCKILHFAVCPVLTDNWVKLLAEGTKETHRPCVQCIWLDAMTRVSSWECALRHFLDPCCLQSLPYPYLQALLLSKHCATPVRLAHAPAFISSKSEHLAAFIGTSTVPIAPRIQKTPLACSKRALGILLPLGCLGLHPNSFFLLVQSKKIKPSI